MLNHIKPFVAVFQLFGFKPVIVGSILHLLTLDADFRPRRNRRSDESVAANDGAFANNDLAAENRRAGVDRNVVADCRMAFLSGEFLPAARRQGAERHALIDFYMLADFRRLSNNDPRPMVDKEIPSDGRARMYVDACFRVRVFRH